MSNLSSGSGLGVNVDVANTAFWNTMGTLAETARAMLSDPRATNEKQQSKLLMRPPPFSISTNLFSSSVAQDG